MLAVSGVPQSLYLENLLPVDVGIKEEWENGKGSFHTQLERWQNLLPSKETLFNYKFFSLSYPKLCLAAYKLKIEYLPQNCSVLLPWQEISLIAMPGDVRD